MTETTADPTPIYTAVAEQTWPCGAVGHNRQVWEDEETGILWCPDCRTEIWVDPPADC